MHIPQYLKILGHIITVDQLQTKNAGNPGEYAPYHGHINIRVDEDIPKDTIVEALLHEIIEVINDKCDLQMQHGVLTVLSEVLFSVLQDNDLMILHDMDYCVHQPNDARFKAIQDEQFGSDPKWDGEETTKVKIKRGDD